MLLSAVSLVLLGPVGPTDLGTDVHEHMPPDHPDAWSDPGDDPLPSIDCNESKDTGYVQGEPFEITVVTVDGKPVEVETANAFYQMAQAAAADGVDIKVNSGFRTMAEQEYFYGCYINCNCNNCNQAAKPGFSNHQSGHALDLNTSAGGVYNWLANHGGDYGFTETVPGEDWHWEWWGGGPPTNGPCGTKEFAAKFAAQSFPYASEPAVMLTEGDVLDAWIDLENIGSATWTVNTRLAPTPRDVASPLAHPEWMSPTRITFPMTDTPPGAVGRFAFKFAANTPGDYFQTFGLVEEGVTWFSDAPLGGGPPDTQLEVHIVVLEGPDPPPPPPTTTDTTDGETSFGSFSGDPGDDTTGGTGDGGTGEGGEDTTAAPTTGATATAGSATQASADSDPDLTAGPDETSDEGCGCDTRTSGGGWLGMLGLLGLLGRFSRTRARERSVSKR